MCYDVQIDEFTVEYEPTMQDIEDSMIPEKGERIEFLYSKGEELSYRIGTVHDIITRDSVKSVGFDCGDSRYLYIILTADGFRRFWSGNMHLMGRV